MSKLSKTIVTTYISADPGSPGSPGVPATEGYWDRVWYTETDPDIDINYYMQYTVICTTSSYTYDTNGWRVPVACTPGTTYIENPADYEATSCSPIWVPPNYGQLATPPRPYTPAQIVENFQEGWNASAQSIVPLIPGSAILFKVMTGYRGIIVGLNIESFAPTFGRIPVGILFADGQANVCELGVIKEPLGDANYGVEFLIGRTPSNNIVYMNYTTGEIVGRRTAVAPPAWGLHAFSMMYSGGDSLFA